MNDVKSFLASKTIWGVGISMLAQLAGRWGYEISPELQGQAIDLILQGVALAGAALAIWGRITASRKIGTGLRS